jgi:GDPmannose 4,6-dehydratase
MARIHHGLDECLYLGNLDSLRDWGHARDYVRAQWLMLQQETPDDYVIATGEQHSVREFVTKVAAEFGTDLEWRGHGISEEGIDSKSGKSIVKVDSRYFRPTEVDTLLGDSTKAKTQLNWKPETTFDTLVRDMVAADAELARRDAAMAKEGFQIYRFRE